VAEVFAGAVLGYGLSLVLAWPVSFGLVRMRERVPTLARAIAPNLGPFMLAVPVSLLLFAWGPLVGIVLGMLYRGALDNLPGAGLGSPNLGLHRRGAGGGRHPAGAGLLHLVAAVVVARGRRGPLGGRLRLGPPLSGAGGPVNGEGGRA